MEEGRAESVHFLFAREDNLETIFLFPGRVSLLSFPCSITKAIVGSPNDIKTEVDKFNPKEVHILLKKWSSKPTNLILKCKDKMFLFNLIPHKLSHYDYIKILGHKEANLKIKPALSKKKEVFNKNKTWKIKKILDFSWEDKK